GHGEGTVYQMPDGRWRAEVSIGWRRNEEGKPIWKRKIVTAKTRTGVQDKLKKVQRDQDRGVNIEPGKVTLGQYFTRWLENTVKPSVRYRTYTSYEQMLRNHIVKSMPEDEWKEKKLDNVPGLGRIPIKKLSRDVFQQFMLDKRQAGNPATLVNYLRVVARVGLNQAVSDGLIEKNAAALARPLKVEEREIQPMTAEEAGVFLMAAQGHRLEAFYTLALGVGIRSGEGCALRWNEDVNLDAGTITIHHTLTRVKGKGLVLAPPKSKTSRRIVELPALCVAALRAHHDRQKLERQEGGCRWRDSGHVFTTTVGTPLDDAKVLKEFKQILGTTDLPKQRVHDLRHAAITMMCDNTDEKVVSTIVGHSDVRLTENIYRHVFKSNKRAAADSMHGVLTRATEAAKAKVEAEAKTKAQEAAASIPSNAIATDIATMPASEAVN
ncbi:MAG: site-specific integrase, partial [Acidobacteria bacterium]|nr:site-specific integrase [Acidobacteriota bacterium]